MAVVNPCHYLSLNEPLPLRINVWTLATQQKPSEQPATAWNTNEQHATGKIMKTHKQQWTTCHCQNMSGQLVTKTCTHSTVPETHTPTVSHIQKAMTLFLGWSFCFPPEISCQTFPTNLGPAASSTCRCKPSLTWRLIKPNTSLTLSDSPVGASPCLPI